MPKLAQVGIAAGLDDEPGARGACEVVRHRQRRAAEEGERRDRHASVADRQQLRYPGEPLGFPAGRRDQVAAEQA